MRISLFPLEKFKFIMLKTQLKVSICFPIIVLCLVHETSSSEIKMDDLWEKFKQKHNRSYETDEAHDKRFAIFQKTVIYVSNHNLEEDLGRHTFRVGLNHFADRAVDERISCIRDTTSMPWPDSDETVGTSNIPWSEYNDTSDPIDIPSYIDYRDLNYVTPIKNQGDCGACYAFSATAALETQWMKIKKKLVALSEQNIIDCDKASSCRGGTAFLSFKYIIHTKGIDTEKSYPYRHQSVKGPCRFEKKNIGATMRSIERVKTNSSEATTKALLRYGPVAVQMLCNDSGCIYYKGKIYSHPTCAVPGAGDIPTDHAMTIIGYNQDEEGRKYWILKNSWGKEWGEKGYMRLDRTLKNPCLIYMYPMVPIV